MATLEKDDDGYRGLIKNPDTGQILFATASTACDPFYERIAHADQKPAIKASKTVAPAATIEEPEAPAAPVIEATPEEEVSTDEADGDFALITLLAEAKGCKDKAALKQMGETVGVKLTMAMNPSTMRERIAAQINKIQAVNTGA